MIRQNHIKFFKGQTITKMELNHFSDLLNEEFINMYLSSNIQTNSNFVCTGPQAPYKTQLDVNYTTNSRMINLQVFAQGQCATGYAFATIGAAQASRYKSVGSFALLSVQQLIDCSQEAGNKGCAGGNPLNSLSYLVNRGMMNSYDYPFTGTSSACQYNATKKFWSIQQCTKVSSNNLTSLQSAILQQPVIVQFDASDPAFIQLATSSNYYGSVPTCGDQINHYMLAIGWGVDIGVNAFTHATYEYHYIKVKNSFGPQWASGGYVKVVYKSNVNGSSTYKFYNTCGMFNGTYFI